jgi:hypothetical protein
VQKLPLHMHISLNKKAGARARGKRPYIKLTVQTAANVLRKVSLRTCGQDLKEPEGERRGAAI